MTNVALRTGRGLRKPRSVAVQDIDAQVRAAADWFTVDKKGLGELRENADPVTWLHELVANSLDEAGTSRVDLTLEPMKPGRYLLSVTDDAPGGFANLTDAYRLFGRSTKRDRIVRGRFNVGEKMVLALAESAVLTTTKGTIYFNPDGTRTENLTKRTQRGTSISIEMHIAKAQAQRAIEDFARVLPPADVTVTLNGTALGYQEPVLRVPVQSLRTVAQTDEGWRDTARNTDLWLYSAPKQAYIYEMGIPVVEIDGRWSVNVQQRVPLTLDRDNVPPAYLRRIYVEIANATVARITPEDSTTVWANAALEDERTSPDAIVKLVTERFGEKVVAFDPSDKEGSIIAKQRGYEVLGGRTFSALAWDNIRAKAPDLIRPAGRVTPSPRLIETSAEGKPSLDRSAWTAGMHAVARYSMALAQVLKLRPPVVHFDSAPTEDWHAAYSPGSLRFNYGRLGKAWFDTAAEADVLSLLIHEFTHDPEVSPNGWNNHQSEHYHRGLTDLGAALVVLGMDDGLPRLADHRKVN